MLIGRIQGANVDLGKPVDWDDSKGECKSLPVLAENTPTGPCMTSAWFPTPDELRALNAGQPVYLSIYGRGHPPVWLCVPPLVVEAVAEPGP